MPSRPEETARRGLRATRHSPRAGPKKRATRLMLRTSSLRYQYYEIVAGTCARSGLDRLDRSSADGSIEAGGTNIGQLFVQKRGFFVRLIVDDASRRRRRRRLRRPSENRGENPRARQTIDARSATAHNTDMEGSNDSVVRPSSPRILAFVPVSLRLPSASRVAFAACRPDRRFEIPNTTAPPPPPRFAASARHRPGDSRRDHRDRVRHLRHAHGHHHRRRRDPRVGPRGRSRRRPGPLASERRVVRARCAVRRRRVRPGRTRPMHRLLRRRRRRPHLARTAPRAHPGRRRRRPRRRRDGAAVGNRRRVSATPRRRSPPRLRPARTQPAARHRRGRRRRSFYSPTDPLALAGWELCNEAEALAPGAACTAVCWRRPVRSTTRAPSPPRSPWG